MTLNRLQRKSDNADYQIRPEIGQVPRYRRVWASRAHPFNQGEDGKCVGYATASLLGAAPIKHIVSQASAEQIFAKAQAMDVAGGLDVEDGGASLLGAMEACKKVGLFGRYLWANDVNDIVDWVIRRGPVLLGVNWYTSLLQPPATGLLELGGVIEGGHAIMVNGYWPQHPQFGDVLVVTNTWGTEWGYRGRGFMPLDVADVLLAENGEAVAPTDIPPHRRA